MNSLCVMHLLPPMEKTKTKNRTNCLGQTERKHCELSVTLRLGWCSNEDPFFISSSSSDLVESLLSVPLKQSSRELWDMNHRLEATSFTFTYLLKWIRPNHS